ncbi:luciferase-like domain-containing protein (plasmid) [Rhizobium gallicum]|uniref:Luciferase-like domain-containing protein n=1 Tax=Rhizobium gallicum TaxID=56730 RepID=A0A1L5NRH7_9HYPH|nr:luciferase-like domain-containing protein [Rhizobium gallicum]
MKRRLPFRQPAVCNHGRQTIDAEPREHTRRLMVRVSARRGNDIRCRRLGSSERRIADQLEERFESYGADGFNVMPAILLGGLDDFVTLVPPELRKRGLVRAEDHGPTLRGQSRSEATRQSRGQRQMIVAGCHANCLRRIALRAYGG